MKKLWILSLIVLSFVSCNSLISSKHKSVNPKKMHNKDEIEVKIFKDTASWVDGKKYQFIKVWAYKKNNIINIENIEKKYIPSTGRISIGIELNDSTHSVLSPILISSNNEALYLIDDFDKYEKTFVQVIYSVQYSVGNMNQLLNEFLSKKIEVNFDSIRKIDLSYEYPKADKEWYNKWKKENPDFKFIRKE